MCTHPAGRPPPARRDQRPQLFRYRFLELAGDVDRHLAENFQHHARVVDRFGFGGSGPLGDPADETGQLALRAGGGCRDRTYLGGEVGRQLGGEPSGGAGLDQLGQRPQDGAEDAFGVRAIGEEHPPPHQFDCLVFFHTGRIPAGTARNRD